jgi:Xaa-Pro dipeptidase
VVRDAGYGEFWKHRGGYSMGLSFPPGLGEGHIIDIKPNDRREIVPGMVFALIPGISVPGVGEVGCFETIVVTEQEARSLSTIAHEVIHQ